MSICKPPCNPPSSQLILSAGKCLCDTPSPWGPLTAFSLVGSSSSLPAPNYDLVLVIIKHLNSFRVSLLFCQLKIIKY